MGEYLLTAARAKEIANKQKELRRVTEGIREKAIHGSCSLVRRSLSEDTVRELEKLGCKTQPPTA